MAAAWRTGMFFHWDPRKYPSLDTALGRSAKVVKGDPDKVAAEMRATLMAMAGEKPDG